MIGQASVSAHFLLQVKATYSVSICIGPVCGGVHAKGFWEAAMGIDMALTTTLGAGNGLDANGVGCREYTFQSKLTNYAEYPQSDGVSLPGPRTETDVAPQLRPERGLERLRAVSCLKITRLRNQTDHNLTALPSGDTVYRSDLDAISAITDSAKTTASGLALIGGFYVYVTVPYLYVAPIMPDMFDCGAVEFQHLISYAQAG